MTMQNPEMLEHPRLKEKLAKMPSSLLRSEKCSLVTSVTGTEIFVIYFSEHCNSQNDYYRELLTKRGHDYHQLIHSDSKPYECKSCDAKYRSKQDLDKHVAKHHSALNKSAGQN